MLIAIDTGGTFTDLTAYDPASGTVRTTKSLTTYANLADGVFDCAASAAVDLAAASVFKHGTTLVINALIQRIGARTALVTTRGFRDILETGRGNRPTPFDLYYRRDPALVPRDLRFEIDERVSGEGEVLVAPSHDEVRALAARLRALQVAAVAVSFLHSYRQPRHEEAVAHWLRDLLPGVFVCHGAALSREWYEYERTATAAANAYVGPQMAGYVRHLDERLTARGFHGKFFMMGSNGGVLEAADSMRAPIALVESGPVGGCIGAAAYAQALGLDHAIAFDMGGTTAKCAVVRSGGFDVKSVYWVGGYERGFPIRGAVIDIVEVGAGGGSIAYADAHGRLRVGPRSAGSTPGPVAYMRGGAEPTITDANIVLGRVDPHGFLGGTMPLDAEAARTAIRARLVEPLGLDGASGVDRMAEGIIAIAAVTMAGAIKRVTVEKGLDPRDFALFAFGGGGPLHAVQIARQLHIPTVIVPPTPGNFSAVGMLLADLRIDETATFVRAANDGALAEATRLLDTLSESIAARLRRSDPAVRVRDQRYAEMRYRGQVHAVRVPLEGVDDAIALRARFEAVYRARYGHVDRKSAVEIVTVGIAGLGAMQRPSFAALRPNSAALAATAPGTRAVYFAEVGKRCTTQVWRRDALPEGFAAPGPALIEEYGSTTVVGPHDRFTIGALGEIRVHLGQG